jgi:hypothetical protein
VDAEGELLAAALEWARRGVPVLPVRPAEKAPLTVSGRPDRDPATSGLGHCRAAEPTARGSGPHPRGSYPRAPRPAGRLGDPAGPARPPAHRHPRTPRRRGHRTARRLLPRTMAPKPPDTSATAHRLHDPALCRPRPAPRLAHLRRLESRPTRRQARPGRSFARGRTCSASAATSPPRAAPIHLLPRPPRRTFRRDAPSQRHRGIHPQQPPDDDDGPILVIGTWTYAGPGWRAPADAALALAAADLGRDAPQHEPPQPFARGGMTCRTTAGC